MGTHEIDDFRSWLVKEQGKTHSTASTYAGGVARLVAAGNKPSTEVPDMGDVKPGTRVVYGAAWKLWRLFHGERDAHTDGADIAATLACRSARVKPLETRRVIRLHRVVVANIAQHPPEDARALRELLAASAATAGLLDLLERYTGLWEHLRREHHQAGILELPELPPVDVVERAGIDLALARACWEALEGGLTLEQVSAMRWGDLDTTWTSNPRVALAHGVALSDVAVFRLAQQYSDAVDLFFGELGDGRLVYVDREGFALPPVAIERAAEQVQTALKRGAQPYTFALPPEVLARFREADGSDFDLGGFDLDNDNDGETDGNE